MPPPSFQSGRSKHLLTFYRCWHSKQGLCSIHSYVIPALRLTAFGLRPLRGFGPPPALRPRAFGRRAVALAKGGPQAGDRPRKLESIEADPPIAPGGDERLILNCVGGRQAQAHSDEEGTINSTRDKAGDLC